MSSESLKKFGNTWQNHLLTEMRQQNINDIKAFMKRALPSDYPFSSMFDGKWRIALPLDVSSSSEAALFPADLKAIATNVLWILQSDDWVLDFSTGMASKKELQTNPKTGETIPRELKMSIGKLFQRLLKNYDSLPEHKKRWITREQIQSIVSFWNDNAESLMSGNAMIIISQHPIDVLRMSDFKGVESCHSQDGAYFHCAVQEAQAHGPIAYVVRAKDYEKIKDRLQEEEIFADNANVTTLDKMGGEPYHRDVQGIVPVARIRIREVYVNGYGSLPVPEESIYGNSISGFVSAVRNWAKTAPNYAKVKRAYVMARDLELRGGEYEDTPTAEITGDYLGTQIGGENYDGELIEREIRNGIRNSRALRNVVNGIEFNFDDDQEWYAIVSFDTLNVSCDNRIDPNKTDTYTLRRIIDKACSFADIDDIDEDSISVSFEDLDFAGQSDGDVDNLISELESRVECHSAVNDVLNDLCSELEVEEDEEEEEE